MRLHRRVADSPSPRIKPRHVEWAVIALWVAYGLTFTHAAIIIGDRWMSWPPEYVVLNQLAFELLYVVLIYFACQYIAVYWLFSATGRRWFAHPAAE